MQNNWNIRGINLSGRRRRSTLFCLLDPHVLDFDDRPVLELTLLFRRLTSKIWRNFLDQKLFCYFFLNLIFKNWNQHPDEVLMRCLFLGIFDVHFNWWWWWALWCPGLYPDNRESAPRKGVVNSSGKRKLLPLPFNTNPDRESVEEADNPALNGKPWKNKMVNFNKLLND